MFYRYCQKTQPNTAQNPMKTAPVHQSSSIWTHAGHQTPHVGSDVVEVCAEILIGHRTQSQFQRMTCFLKAINCSHYH